MSIFKKVYTNSSDFLIEIGCEELPAKGLLKLTAILADKIIAGLQKNGINHGPHQIFATPRRLAVLIAKLDRQQPEMIIERRGPMLANAFTADGQPTPAAIGFARSCNVEVSELKRLEVSKGACLFYKQKKPGVKTEQILPEIISQALAALPIARPMTWNDGRFVFVRPVRWVVMLFGDTPIITEILGIKSGIETFGHRFLSPQAIRLKNPQDYAGILEKQGYVIASFEQRKARIYQLLKNIAPKNSNIIINEDLLNEVTGIVEWPVALLGKFNERFLKLPNEVLISSIQKHQKSFPIAELLKNSLLPYFATISNIKSQQPERVVKGNERIINARLSDAEFFYNTDTKKTLEESLQNLKGIIFQAGLGSMYDKAERLSKLSDFMVKFVDSEGDGHAKRAGLLAKADLTTEMVGEFPELQGIMGFYYALNSKESEIVAVAIKEQYLPRHAGDRLPQTMIGSVIAIADRIDLLVGIIGINKAPTGDKDPLGLRRAALGVIRIILEKEIDLDLRDLIVFTKDNYGVFSLQVVEQVLEFIYERLRGYYAEKDITSQIFNAVLARQPTNLLDFNERVKAVLAFSQLPEAESLAIANKRVHNILQKSAATVVEEIETHLLTENAEKKLAEQIRNKESEIEALLLKRQYTRLLKSLAELKPVIDVFFDQVMVMVDDEKLRVNRIALLARLRKLFLHCADISML
jgi:glycyl-tRNA synthetase beta chain